MMVRINHSRPSLKYLDNFRRELRRENRPSPTWFEPEKFTALGLGKADEEEFSQHVVAFSRLPAKQQKIADYAFSAYGGYLHAISGVISLIMKGSSKKRKEARAAKEQAEEKLIIAGAVLVASIWEDIEAKRDGFLHWFAEFYDDLDREGQMAWAEFGEKLFHDCTALFIAQQLSDDPDRVQEIRESLLVDEDE